MHLQVRRARELWKYHPLMSLARVWRRQLCAASSAALVVPFAMFAALAVLALGGGFGQIGVLGQLFAGPSLPSSGPLVGSAAGAQRTLPAASAPIPVIPAPGVRSRPGARSGGTYGGAGTPVLGAGRGTGTSGVALTLGGAGITQGPTGTPVSSGSPGAASGSPGAASGSPRPVPGPSPSPGQGPGPSPKPTLVDTAVEVVTSVTEQVPAPAGAIATQAVQSAGSAADGVLPPLGSPATGPPPARAIAQGLSLP
jgi:hypothetical protein